MNVHWSVVLVALGVGLMLGVLSSTDIHTDEKEESYVYCEYKFFQPKQMGPDQSITDAVPFP